MGVLAALPPLSIDISLPGLPAIAKELGASDVMMQATLGGFMLAFALGQLFWGPLSDRYGRRPVILAGLFIYAASAIGCVVASSVSALVTLRVLQGFGACAATVAGNALVRDLFVQSERRAMVQSVVTAVMSLAPIFAPLIGAGLIVMVGWRGVFLLLAIAGLMLSMAVLIMLSQKRLQGSAAASAAQQVASHSMGSAVWRDYRAFLRIPASIPLALVVGLTFCGQFAFISGSPFVLINALHVSSTAYAVVFSVASAAALIGAVVTAHSARRGVTVTLILRIASRGLGVAGVLSIAVGLLISAVPSGTFWPVLMFAGAMAIFSFFAGMLTPTVYTLGLEHAGDMAGVGAAVLGATMMTGGAFGSTAEGAIPLSSYLSIGVLALFSGVSAAIVAAMALRMQRQ